MLIILFILSIIGLLLSIYAYTVECKLKNNINYKPACDLSDQISCSKVMMSPYANIFIVSNACAGIMYFALAAMLAAYNSINILFLLALVSCFISIGLGYLLYFKIKSFCLVCTSIYLINFLMLFIATYKLFR